MGRVACTLYLLFAFAAIAAAQVRGVIQDPDGYVNVRAGKSTESAVVAKVKNEEPFSFEGQQGEEWFKVKLSSGKSGWMHSSRIRLFFTKKDLPSKSDLGPDTELGQMSHREGKDFYEVMTAAVNGSKSAQKTFFQFSEEVDGAAAEGYFGMLATVLHLIGDNNMAGLLDDPSPLFHKTVRNAIVMDEVMAPFETMSYLKRCFPKTTGKLFQKEISGWPSPDQRYLIRKSFWIRSIWSIPKSQERN